jgi:large conductance mechanosensitive channel
MFQEFRTFINRGNVLDLAVAVIIGGAFGAIVTSMTEDLIMPLVAAVTGSPDFSGYFIRLGAVPADYAGDRSDYAALKAAGVPMIGLGAFVTALVNFLIIAFAVFLLVRYANRVMPRQTEAPAGPPEDVVLLREIRDLLKEGR